MNRQTVIIIGASTALGFLGDVLTYSIAASKGTGKFSVHVPKGKDLLFVIAAGVIGGYLIDLAVRGIQRAASSEAENALDDLMDAEKKKIAEGKVPPTAKPTQVIYAV